MKMKMCIVVMLVSVLSVIQSANAVLITNGSTTVFADDGFESNSQVEPNAYPGSLDADPDSASIGSWWMVKEGGYRDVQVTSYDSGSLPHTPYGGNNYLRSYAVADWANEFLAVFSEPQTSGMIHAEFMVNTWGDNSHRCLIKLGDGTNYAVSLLLLNGSSELKYHDGNAWQGTGLTINEGTWQKWEIDYAPGASTFTVSVDDVSSGSLAVCSVVNNVDRLLFNTGTTRSWLLIDAVPEPATIGLLSLSLVFLRRQR